MTPFTPCGRLTCPGCPACTRLETAVLLESAAGLIAAGRESEGVAVALVAIEKIKQKAVAA